MFEITRLMVIAGLFLVSFATDVFAANCNAVSYSALESKNDYVYTMNRRYSWLGVIAASFSNGEIEEAIQCWINDTAELRRLLKLPHGLEEHEFIMQSLLQNLDILLHFEELGQNSIGPFCMDLVYFGRQPLISDGGWNPGATAVLEMANITSTSENCGALCEKAIILVGSYDFLSTLAIALTVIADPSIHQTLQSEIVWALEIDAIWKQQLSSFCNASGPQSY